MAKIKVLNLYAGIGGNRKLWKDVDVTAVEIKPVARGKGVRLAPKPKPVAVAKVRVADIVKQARKKAPKEPGKGKKFCPGCYMTVGARTLVCNHCGYEF